MDLAQKVICSCGVPHSPRHRLLRLWRVAGQRTWEYARGKIPRMTSRWPSRSVPVRSSRRKGTEPIQENGSQQEKSMQTIKMLSRKPPSYAKLDYNKEAAPRLAVFFKQSSPTWAATSTLLLARPLGRQQWCNCLASAGSSEELRSKGRQLTFQPQHETLQLSSARKITLFEVIRRSHNWWSYSSCCTHPNSDDKESSSGFSLTLLKSASFLTPQGMG